MATTTRIEPATIDHIDALLEGPDAFTSRFGLAVADGYLDFPEALPVAREALGRGLPPEWSTHLIIAPAATGGDADVLIGIGGYKGPPGDSGEVEIGYSVSPQHRGRGHATAAAAEMVRRAFAAGVTVVSAHTLAESNPSTRVLQRCGFTRTAEIDDPDDGPIWRWELEALPASGLTST